MSKHLDCVRLLDVFLANRKVRNQWLEDRWLKAYVRKANRFVDGRLQTSLDIATMSCERPGMGRGSRFIELSHAKNPFEITFLENVINPKLVEHLISYGWVRDGRQDFAPCFYKQRGEGIMDNMVRAHAFQTRQLMRMCYNYDLGDTCLDRQDIYRELNAREHVQTRARRAVAKTKEKQ